MRRKKTTKKSVKNQPLKRGTQKKMVESHEKRKLKFIFFALLKNWLNLMKIRKQRKKKPLSNYKNKYNKEDIVYFT